MSVDTYLKGKDTSAYERIATDGVDVLVSPSMARVANRISLTASGWLRRGLAVDVAHEHGPACQH